MKIGENLPPLSKGQVVVDKFEAAGADAAAAKGADAAAALLQTNVTQTALLQQDSTVKVISTPVFKAVEDPVTKEVKLVREEHPLTLPYE